MNQHKPRSIVVGVDVGGSKKGFHAVALQDGQCREKFSALIAAEIAAWCRKLKAFAVDQSGRESFSIYGIMSLTRM